MSLLNIRREWREGRPGPDRPAQMWKLVVGIVIVAFVLWYLRQW